jgi:LAO/AO transport system kinase
MSDLSSKILNGDTRAIARMITLIENNDSEATRAMHDIHKKSGHAHVIGITGVMGSGKSSLIFDLAYSYRKRGKKIGIIAIDPTSPFSGGALLGDRVRMMELSTDDNVFIRSMGTHGMLGGVSSSVFDVVEIFDAAGMDIILIETVGVGQAEVDIVKVADTTLVVLVPGLGDSIQTIKAGLMEIADIFVVNKADKPGVEQVVAEIEAMLDISSKSERTIPIVKTSTKENQGITELIKEIEKHCLYLKKGNKLEIKRRIRYETELTEIIRKRLMNLIFDESKFKDTLNILIDQISKKELDAYSAADEILGKILK